MILTRLAWAAAVLLLTLFLAFFAFRSAGVLVFPYQVEYGEGPVLDWTRQVAAGRLPYKPIEPFPWNFSVYTPGYLVGSAGLSALLPVTPWFGGRLLSLLSALGLAALIARAVALERPGARSAAWIAAALWLASPYLFRWATFYRPDLFALFWSALGIVLVSLALKQDRRVLALVAALCFVLSFYTKQSFFAAPLAAALYLAAYRRDWLLPLIGTGVAGGIGIGGLLWVVTGGAALDNLIAANANPFSWQNLLAFERSFFSIVLVLAVLAAWQMWRARGEPRAGLLSLYALLGLLVTVSVGKAGAWENYFLEPLWALCVLAGHTIAALAQSRGWRSIIAPLLAMIQLALFLPGFERLSPAAERAWLDELRADSEALQTTLATIPRDAVVWSEQMGALAESGREVPLHSFVYTQLERQGLWNPAPLTDQLATGLAPLLIQRFDAVSDPLSRDRWSRTMLDASERGYAMGQRAGEWLHRPSQPFPGPDEPRPLEEGLTLLNWMMTAVDSGEPLLAPVVLRAGEAIRVHLLWQSAARQSLPITASVQLFAPDGNRVAQDDRPVREGTLAAGWPTGAVVRDEHPLVLPETLEPGAYTLLVALYESDSGTPRGSVTLEGLLVRPPD